MPKKYSCERILNKHLEKALDFYIKQNEDKKFVFLPDLEFFSKWVHEYSTYLVYHNKKIVGLFTITSIYSSMKTGLNGKLALPLLFNPISGNEENVMRCLLHICSENSYDVLYTYCNGNVTRDLLKNINAIPTANKAYFNLYNNSMNLSSSDICVPLF